MNNSSFEANDGDLFHYERLSTSAAIAFAFVTSLLAIMTVGCNFVLILVIVRTTHLHTKTNAMIISVAISELFVGLFVMPFVAALWFNQDLVLSAHACQFSAFMTSLTTSTKSLGMLSVSVDRCLAMSHPLQYSSYINRTTTAVAVLSVWLVGLIFAAFPLAGVGRYGFMPVYHRCLSDFVNHATFSLVAEAVYSAVPATGVSVSLLVVLLEARAHHRVITIAQLAVAMYSGPAAGPHLTRATRTTYKAMRTYIIITLVYLFTCLPRALYVLATAGVNARHSASAFSALTFLTYVCCVATPLVITTLNNKFKDSVKLLFVRVNRVRPSDKEAFTISTGLHSILETSIIMQMVPKKDNITRQRDAPAGPGWIRAPPIRFVPRTISVLPEIQSSSSSDVTGGQSQRSAHAQLRKALSYPSRSYDLNVK